MDVPQFLQVVAAVIFGNAASFAFFMGAMRASKEQKEGKADHELTKWVYFCLIGAPLLALPGLIMLK